MEKYTNETSSVLNLYMTPTANDDGTTFRCRAENPLLGTVLEDSFKMIVHRKYFIFYDTLFFIVRQVVSDMSFHKLFFISTLIIISTGYEWLALPVSKISPSLRPGQIRVQKLPFLHRFGFECL